MRIELDDRVYQGTPRQIVEAWKAISFRPPSESLRAYMAWSVAQLGEAGVRVDAGDDVSDVTLRRALALRFTDEGAAASAQAHLVISLRKEMRWQTVRWRSVFISQWNMAAR